MLPEGRWIGVDGGSFMIEAAGRPLRVDRGPPETDELSKRPHVRPFQRLYRSKTRDGTGWLGRQDSNLGMAESKSDHFSFQIKACSEKFAKFGPLSNNRLAFDSECGRANRASLITNTCTPFHGGSSSKSRYVRSPDRMLPAQPQRQITRVKSTLPSAEAG